jgi:nucleoside-diphosphate-sugar epimerase
MSVPSASSLGDDTSTLPGKRSVPSHGARSDVVRLGRTARLFEIRFETEVSFVSEHSKPSTPSSQPSDRDPSSLAVLFGGSGDTGQRLARALESRGVEVVVTTRRDPNELSDDVFESVDVRQWGGAGDTEGLVDIVEAVERRVDTDSWVGYNLVGDWLKHPEEAIFGTVRTLVETCERRSSPMRLVHCSAISVYGDRPGEVLDESSPRSPDLEVGRIHARAEDLLLEAESPGFEPFVLRLPHIYGPGRERTFDLMCRGDFAVAGDGTNRMHHLYIEDLIDALVSASTASRPTPPLLNVVDDEAAPYGDYCDFVTDACNQPPLDRIPLEEARRTDRFAEWLGPHMKNDDVLEEFYKYMTSNVVVDNSLAQDVLDLELDSPSYKEGLHEMLRLRDDVSLDSRSSS